MFSIENDYRNLQLNPHHHLAQLQLFPSLSPASLLYTAIQKLLPAQHYRYIAGLPYQEPVHPERSEGSPQPAFHKTRVSSQLSLREAGVYVIARSQGEPVFGEPSGRACPEQSEG